MRALVTGANGFIGSTLVRRLVKEGMAVRCHVHRSADRLKGLEAEIVAGDVESPSDMAHAVRGCDVVFHLAARATDWGQREEFMTVNALGTKNLLDAALRAKVSRFVLASSLAVHRFGGFVDADEDTPADQERYAYGASKVAAEKTVRAAQKEIEIAIIRPGLVVFGPEDTTAFVHMAPMLAQGRWTHVDRGRSRLCYSFVDNLAHGFFLVGTHPAAAGGTFNITDDLCLTWKEFVSAIISAFGAEEHSLSVPRPIARAAGIGLEAVWKVFRAKVSPPITDYRTALVASDFHFNCEKAKRVLGYRPIVGFEEGLRRTVVWYLEKVKSARG